MFEHYAWDKLVRSFRQKPLREHWRHIWQTYRQSGWSGVDALFRLSNRDINNRESRTLPHCLRSAPQLMYLEISSCCNLECTMCGRAHHEIRPEDEGLMTMPIFQKALELVEPGTIISLFGRGETLIHPEFPEMLRLAKARGAIVGFNTNGQLLKPVIAEKMVAYGQDSLVISCSAGTKETYEKIHHRGSFDQLIENIRRLNGFKQAQGSPTPFIAFEFVAMRQNIEELPKLIELAHELMISNILVIHVTAHSPEMAEAEQLRQEKFAELTRQVFEHSTALAQTYGINLTLPELYNPYTKKLAWEKEEIEKLDRQLGQQGHQGICLEPWQTFYVKFNGDIMPCVITNRALGNLGQHAALDIWNGPPFIKFRERMKGGDKPPECAICHLLPGNTSYNVMMGSESLYESEL
jgi:radical SAM protein with 4Fe4S-binding SPASM domain